MRFFVAFRIKDIFAFESLKTPEKEFREKIRADNQKEKNMPKKNEQVIQKVEKYIQ